MNRWVEFIISVFVGTFGAWSVCSMYSGTTLPWEWDSAVKGLAAFIGLASIFVFWNSGEKEGE